MMIPLLQTLCLECEFFLAGATMAYMSHQLQV